MAAYYAKRAAYYERVYHKPERQSDLRAMETWLHEPFTGRHVLEIACGTGWWTPHGAKACASWLATDLSSETMAVAQSKTMPPGKVAFEVVDAYDLKALGARTFDAAFSGCWWSHIPLQRLDAWLNLLHHRLRPGARVVHLDNSFVQTSNLPIHRRDDHGNTYQMRCLDDSSTHEVVKNFPAPEEAFSRLGPRARNPQWVNYTHYWLLSYTLA